MRINVRVEKIPQVKIAETGKFYERRSGSVFTPVNNFFKHYIIFYECYYY